MTQLSDPPRGIVIESDSQTPLYLPLEEVKVQVKVVDTTARVTLTQSFSNISKHSTPQSRYVFPVPARSAVCAFEMKTDNGRFIQGIAKERKQAAEEHRQAVRAGKLTSLVEWSTNDVFSISLGPIPGDQRISTTITYVLDLMDDDAKDRVRFQLPMYVGARYGEAPSAVITGSQAHPTTRVRIEATVHTQGTIKNVTSPTHSSLRSLPERNRSVPNHASVLYESSRFLQEDFVLLIDAQGLENPRGFVERHPQQKDSFAVQLTVVPRFNLPPIPSQEYIFLVDCSGSMGGDRIVTAKQSLSALLKSLPRKGTQFNIFRFGSTCTSFLGSSKAYDESTVRRAESYINSMQADLGGTEIQRALQRTLESRNTAIPTSIFVLTDGETYDIDDTLTLVLKHVNNAADNAHLRVFTLGIGSTASSAMCESIARSGNGICLMAATTEDILGKCAKLVNAAKSFLIRNVSCHWGEQPGTGLLNIQQVPYNIDTLYPGLRFIAFALIHGEYKLPQEVIVRGQRDGHGAAVELKIPITEVTAEAGTPPLIHTLAAKRLITEFEENRGGEVIAEASKEAHIIELGTKFQLASRYTSFIAVEHDKEVLPPGFDNAVAPPEYVYDPTVEDQEERGGSSRMMLPAAFQSVARSAQSTALYYNPSTSVQYAPPSPASLAYIPMHSPPTPLSEVAYSRSKKRRSIGAVVGGFFSKLPSPTKPSFSFAVRPQARRPSASSSFSSSARTLESKPAPSSSDSSFDLIRLQSFDGSFSMDDSFVAIVGKSAAEKYRNFNLTKSVWATILAIAYLQIHLANQPELLDGLVEKATDFVSDNGLPAGVDLESLLTQAKEILRSGA